MQTKIKKTSIKADKGTEDWVVAIFCDYGKPEQKRMIRASYSIDTGEKAWKKFYKMFSKNGYRCWQEMKNGQVINDSKLT